MKRVTTELRESEKRILKVLQDRKEHKFTDLKKETGLSFDSLNDSLKLLQKRPKNMVIRDVDSRKYSITKKGLDYLDKSNTIDTIKGSPASVEIHPSLPVNSIVALNIPTLTKKQSDNFMAGTPNIAELCFNQFIRDLQNKESCPASGVVVYTASIDVGKAKDWLDTAEGKKYLITKQDLDDSN